MLLEFISKQRPTTSEYGVTNCVWVKYSLIHVYVNNLNLKYKYRQTFSEIPLFTDLNCLIISK